MIGPCAGSDDHYLRIEELEAKLEKLELENRVMATYINHRRKHYRGPIGSYGGFDSFMGAISHNEKSCDACTALISTFFPSTTWNGWAL